MKKISTKYRKQIDLFFYFPFQFSLMGIFYVRNCLGESSQEPIVCSATYYRSHNANLTRTWNKTIWLICFRRWIPRYDREKFLAEIKTGLIPYRRSEIRVTRKVVRSKRKLRNYDASTGNLTIFLSL